MKNYALNVKEGLLELIDDVKNLASNEQERSEINLLHFLFEKQDETFILKHFIEDVLKFKKQIIDHDKDFFINNSSIFYLLGKDRIKYYSNKITKETSKEDIDSIFDHLTSIIGECERYILSVS